MRRNEVADTIRCSGERMAVVKVAVQMGNRQSPVDYSIIDYVPSRKSGAELMAMNESWDASSAEKGTRYFLVDIKENQTSYLSKGRLEESTINLTQDKTASLGSK